MLENEVPREQVGRDTFSRYKAQIRSATIASLAILEGEAIDRVYCDLHDDFVIRQQGSDGAKYLFYQVKTNAKHNHNWTLSEVFGLNSKLKDQSKQDTEKIKDSFFGKLLLHTVVFDEGCQNVVFQTNIHMHDEIDNIVEDIRIGLFNNKYTQVILDKFNDCYKDNLSENLSQAEVQKKLSKLSFDTDVFYLKDNENFEPFAREKIYAYSEIDLDRTELKVILLKLVDMVENKSSGIIIELTAESIEKLAGISIDDLLSVLSISRDAYYNLLEGGDSKAIKSASIIQRLLKKAGAGDNTIAYCSRCKSEWDIWVRKNRHIIIEFDLHSITQQIANLISPLIENSNSVDIALLRKPINALLDRLRKEELIYDLNENLIVGGIFSELVKGKS